MDSYQSYLDDKIEDMRKDIKGHYAPYPADFDGKVTSIESFDYVDTYVAFTNKKNYDSWGEHKCTLQSLQDNCKDRQRRKRQFHSMLRSTAQISLQQVKHLLKSLTSQHLTTTKKQISRRR